MSRSSSSTLWVGLGTVAVVAVLFVLLIVFGKTADESAGLTTRQVAMTCTTDMATQFHIHPHLSIVVDGVTQVVPANIGIVSGCMNPLHTHDTDGIIHVESPVKRDFTLGDFFAVWGQSMTREGYTLTVTADSAVVEDPENLVVKDKQQLVMTYVKNAVQD